MLKSSDVPTVRFQPTKFREGYDMAEVDAFLLEVGAALEACERRLQPLLQVARIENARFQPTKFRQGYDQDQVDNFLDDAIAALRSYGY